MPAIREHDDVQNSLDDDDDMPPLVDNPMPSMTFTFATDMTPINYAPDSCPFYELPSPPDPSAMFIMSPPTSPSLTPTRPANSTKRRDASHIPRPPNAFILFRSSFIKAQHIPDKIEGNHSSLSKIIGMYWKSLPREERQVWEAKAVVAQAEHRKKYPDWRFRPGNVIGKVKDGPRKRSNRKGRGEAEEEEKNRQKRCAKIARLLEEGMTGAILEDAVREYDKKAGPVADAIKKGSPTQSAAHEARGGRHRKHKQLTDIDRESSSAREEKACRPRAHTISASPPDANYKFASTADMHKRCSSVPATLTKLAASDDAVNASFQASSIITFPCSPAMSSFTVYDMQEMSPLSSPELVSLPDPGFSSDASFQPAMGSEVLLPSLDPDVVDYGSPASSTMDYIQTPILTPSMISDDPWYVPASILDDDLGIQPAPFLSTYSSLTGWAGEEPRYFTLESTAFPVETSCEDLRPESDPTAHGWGGMQHYAQGLHNIPNDCVV